MSHDKPVLDPSGLTGTSRRNFLKFTGTLTAAAAITAAVSACSGGPESTGGGGGGAKGGSTTIDATLAFALSGGMDPANASSAVATAANQHAFEGLIDLDPATREPYLALAKEQPKASADGKTWTVTLRDGAKFSDGTPVTTADVAHSFTRALDPEMLMSQFISFISAVKAKDATTVEFTLKAPFALFPQRIAVIKIVPKAKTGDAAASKAFDTKPVGSGPWKVDSADANNGLTFSANPHYNGPRKAKATKMIWHTTTEASTRVADLEGGRSQAVEAVPYINVKQVESKKKVEAKQAFNQLFLMFNCSKKPFDDKRVRQALHYALDKKAIISTALQGYGTAAESYLDPANAAYQKASVVYGFDQAKAKSLLKAAGAEGLSFELVTTDAAFVKDIAPLLVDAWKQIGVTVKLNTAPSSSVYAPAPDGLVSKDTFQVLAASGDPTVFGVDTDLLMRWFYFGETWPQKRYRWDQASRDKVAGWLDQAAAETDEAKQKAIWKQVLDFVAEEVPLYPVLHTKVVTGWDDSKLADFQPTSTTGLYFLNASRKA